MSRLTYETDGVSVSVERIGRSTFWPHKFAYRWTFTDASDDKVLATGDDLECVDQYGTCDALVTLLNFVQAWAESGRDGENANLFPAELRDVADWDSWATDALLTLKDEES